MDYGDFTLASIRRQHDSKFELKITLTCMRFQDQASPHKQNHCSYDLSEGWGFTGRKGLRTAEAGSRANQLFQSSFLYSGKAGGHHGVPWLVAGTLPSVLETDLILTSHHPSGQVRSPETSGRLQEWPLVKFSAAWLLCEAFPLTRAIISISFLSTCVATLKSGTT